MIPPLAARLEACDEPLRRPGRRAPRAGDGFWSGTAVGASLGLLYAPCAGPILAGVITVSASQSFNAGRLAVALGYGLGSAVVLYLLMLGGRSVVAPLARRGAGLQIAMGAVMVVVALAMLGNYDIRFQNTIATTCRASSSTRPKASRTPPSATVGAGRHPRRIAHGVGARRRRGAPRAGRRAPTGHADSCRCSARRPNSSATEHWFNTPGDKPLTLRALRGRVVLVDFWTYSCINCIRTLPYLKAWDKRYRKDGLTIVGVHTPEFPFEREAGNVEEAIERNGIRYPVVQDNEQATWNAYGNQYWPAEYFIDANGNVRYAHFGEGEYGEKEQVIRELLAEAGERVRASEPGATGSRPRRP